MPAIVKLSIEALAEAIASLDLEEKRQLQEMLEQSIFEDEEAAYEDDPETLAEIQAVRHEYATGEYQTYDESLARRNTQGTSPLSDAEVEALLEERLAQKYL